MSRPYRSARRIRAAEVTRRAILDAARRLFAERGYNGATIAAIAEAADVAIPTVYASVGGKTALLIALQEHIDEQTDVPATMTAMQTTSEPVEVLRLSVSLTRRINEQFGDIISIWDAAARTEPDAASATAEGMRRHRASFRAVAERLASLGALRPGLDVAAAADTLGILTSFRTWQTLVGDYGLSWSAAAEWIIAQAQTSAVDCVPSRLVTTTSRAP